VYALEDLKLKKKKVATPFNDYCINYNA